MEGAARMFSVLSDPARLEILLSLCCRKGCVSELQLATGRAQPNVSQHLRVLRDAGLVDCRREGRKACYSIRKPEVKRLLALAKKIS